MKNLNLITPEGTKDYIFGEVLALRDIEKSLSDVFHQNSYREIITPTLEFYSLFNSPEHQKRFTPESFYRFFDEKGRTLTLRRDCTLPVARLASTRLKNEKLPLKLFYNQNVFVSSRKNFGAPDELFQSGVELIGVGGLDADISVLKLAKDAIEAIGIKNYRFEIGDVRFFKFLSENIENIDNLSELAFFKSYDKIDNEDIRELASLFGSGDEILERAEILFNKNPKCIPIFSQFKQLLNSGIADFSVDLCQPKHHGYYTGLIFNVYADGIGSPILSGGRYDNLMAEFGWVDDNGVSTPAAGFAVYLNSAIKCLLA